ncbi:hypothetical protein MVEG_11648 [Podila verticillata NRRL 6337]|uniref:Uncharacterized protein n=1 Tax=Podila verticillata NRRL 6337 TaxID=1069443 RepID=A0A086TKG2_9FUNG|nr:hypothetical protein MVEG_11648 [Podila verticillata NRRL 6337]
MSPDPTTGSTRCQVCQYLLSPDEAPTLTCNKKWALPCSSVDIKSADASIPLVSLPTSLTVSAPFPSVAISPTLSATLSSTVAVSPFPTAPSSSPEPVSQGDKTSGSQSFLDKTVEIAGVRMPMIALISSGVGLLVIILVVSVLVVCQRRRRRIKQRNQFKGKGLMDPEKGGYSRHDDDDDDDDDGHPYRYGHNAHSTSSSGHKATDTKPKKDQYPSQQMSRSAASSFTPRLQHQRSGSRSPDRPHSTSELLPIASKHLSLDGSPHASGSRHNSASVLFSSSSSLVPPPPSSIDHQIPPIRQDALLSSISLSSIPYVPKSTFTPRSHLQSEPAILMVSSPRQSECSFVELIPIEETPRLAHTALAMPNVHEAQEAVVAEVVVPVLEEVSETLVLELGQEGCSQETLVETHVPTSTSDAQIQTDSSTDVEAWPVKGPMSKRQLKKQRRMANRQAAWERRETAILKNFLARGGSVSRRHSKLGQGHRSNDNDNSENVMNKVRPIHLDTFPTGGGQGFRARKDSLRRAKLHKSHARREAEGKCLGCQRGLCRVPPWQWEGKQRARVLHEGNVADIVYGSYEAVDELSVKTLTTSPSTVEQSGGESGFVAV